MHGTGGGLRAKPIDTMWCLAIAVMIGDGCCAFVSISLGQDEVHRAKQSVGNAVVLCAE